MCQPLDQGIIKVFKGYYRKNLMRFVIAKCETATSSSDIVSSVSVLNAVMWINEAWKDVKPTTISNCLKKAGFDNLDTVDAEFDEEDDLPLQVLIDRAKQENIISDCVSEGEFLTFDDEIEIFPCLSPDTIIEDIILESCCDTNASATSTEDQNADVSNEEVEPAISNKEALACLSKLKSYSLLNNIDCIPQLSASECMIHKFIVQTKQIAIQKPITSYFTTCL